MGTWILVLLAYYVNEWRMLILAVTSPLVLAVIAWGYLSYTSHILSSISLEFRIFLQTDLGSSFRWLPESARWLLANGRAEEAHKYLRKCAETNNKAKLMDSITPEADGLN